MYTAGIDYVRQQLANGVTIDQIKSALQAQGWDNEAIHTVINQTIGTTNQTASTVSFAPLLPRLGAILVDSVILCTANILIAIFFRPSFQDIFSIPPLILTLLPFTSIIIPWFYFAGFHSSALQATPGKLLFRLFVTSTNGSRISFLRATGRVIVASSLNFIIIPPIISLIMAGAHPKKQTLHDLVASTLVLKR